MSDDGYGDDSGGFNDGEGYEQNLEDLDEDNEITEVTTSMHFVTSFFSKYLPCMLQVKYFKIVSSRKMGRMTR